MDFHFALLILNKLDMSRQNIAICLYGAYIFTPIECRGILRTENGNCFIIQPVWLFCLLIYWKTWCRYAPSRQGPNYSREKQCTQQKTFYVPRAWAGLCLLAVVCRWHDYLQTNKSLVTKLIWLLTFFVFCCRVCFSCQPNVQMEPVTVVGNELWMTVTTNQHTGNSS